MTSLNISDGDCILNESRLVHILLIPIPFVSGILNLVVWLSATVYREKLLRQSYVYSCVTSTLLSNVCFLGFHVWDEFGAFLMPPLMSVIPPGPKMQVMWALCASGAISLMFVMCGNLSVLIYVMLDSTYFQLPKQTSSRQRHTSRNLDVKRRKAAFLIALSWLLPLALTIAAVMDWNCTEKCDCSPGSMGELCPRSKGCSVIWPPLTNSFMAVNIALWFVEITSLAILTVTGIRHFQASRDHMTSSVVQTVSSGPDNDPSAKSGNATELSDASAGVNTPPEAAVPSNNTRNKNILRALKLNPRLRLVASLSTLFITCTIPLGVVFLVDVRSSSINVVAGRLVSMLGVQLYTLFCPILLLIYMSSLKTALIRLITAILFCFR